MDCETISFTHFYNPNRKVSHLKEKSAEFFRNNDDWCRFLIYKLVRNCKDINDLTNQKEKLKIITFNYDISFELRLIESLLSIDIFDIIDDDDEKTQKTKIMSDFIGEIVIHVYGKIRDYNQSLSMSRSILEEPTSTEYDSQTFQYLIKSHLNLNLIAPKLDEQDLKNDKIFIQCKEIMNHTRYLYAFGFGFDEENCKKIGFDKAIKDELKFYYTNYENSAVINKRVANLFGLFEKEKNPDGLFTNNHSMIRDNNVSRKVFIEKSIKNVYKALSEDFVL